MARLPLFKRSAGHSRSTGDADESHIAVLEDRAGRFQRRFSNHANQIVDADIFVDRLVESFDAFSRNFAAAGMRVNDQGVATGNHADGVSRDRGQRVGHRRDSADNAKRCMFDNRQSTISAVGLSRQELGAGTRSPSVLSFSILWTSRPILVSFISMVPSSSHWAMEMRRM